MKLIFQGTSTRQNFNNDRKLYYGGGFKKLTQKMSTDPKNILDSYFLLSDFVSYPLIYCSDPRITLQHFENGFVFCKIFEIGIRAKKTSIPEQLYIF